MTASKSSPSSFTDMVRQSQMMFAMVPTGAPQAEHFWDMQDKMLSDSEVFAKHWFERRHTATRTALETAKDIAETGPSNPAAAVKAITDWQAHSMGRIAEDFREWSNLCARCAAHMGRAELEAGEDGLKQVAKSAGSTKRRKDDIPV
ncbi:hypothetical protein FDP25_04855 [Roseovarius sp. A21]|uniref:Phasin protein n=1 Tax=Roseovarius bejariae TaxID=2576383 RepID=A0A844D0S2_9RHOB|nr:hypothetical protein [Roseovarius bejariae]MRU14758.1 hypothetical protein [Roseovarius bejariae]